MELSSVLVTGANRGIGLEFVKQLVNLPNPPRIVFATYRNQDTVKALTDVRDASKKSQVLLIKMDVTKGDEIETARQTVADMVGDEGLTLLVNNAGAAHKMSFPTVTDENLLFHFTTNTLGPLNVLKAMLPLLQKAAGSTDGGTKSVSRAACLNISSMGGSNAGLASVPPQFLDYIGYRISKAALNMAMSIIAAKEKNGGVLIVQMCPGWVKTDMGTGRGRLEVEDSVATMLQTVATLDASHHGAFLDNKGNAIPF